MHFPDLVLTKKQKLKRDGFEVNYLEMEKYTDVWLFQKTSLEILDYKSKSFLAVYLFSCER